MPGLWWIQLWLIFSPTLLYPCLMPICIIYHLLPLVLSFFFSETPAFQAYCPSAGSFLCHFANHLCWISCYVAFFSHWDFILPTELSKSIFSYSSFVADLAFLCVITFYYLLFTFEFSFLLLIIQGTLGHTEFKRLYKISCNEKSCSSLTPCLVNAVDQQHHPGPKFWALSVHLQFLYLPSWSWKA